MLLLRVTHPPKAAAVPTVGAGVVGGSGIFISTEIELRTRKKEEKK